jgi:hypothetical protein
MTKVILLSDKPKGTYLNATRVTRLLKYFSSGLVVGIAIGTIVFGF